VSRLAGKGASAIRAGVGTHNVSNLEKRDTNAGATPHPEIPGRGVSFPVSHRVSQTLTDHANETVIGMTAILGYARVSTTGQDLEAQLSALGGAGAEANRVFTDKLSGSAKTDRPGLVSMLDYARPGDTVVVTAIDRLGRSVAEVTRTIAGLIEQRITLRALREGVDTATPTGPAVAAIMATLAELELELGRERRAASRESRRARQLPATKPAKLTMDRQEQLRRLAATGEPIYELAKAFGISRATAYRYLSKTG
jgi:DNA invertase Pin-like site-specific DNA recombinase